MPVWHACFISQEQAERTNLVLATIQEASRWTFVSWVLNSSIVVKPSQNKPKGDGVVICQTLPQTKHLVKNPLF